MSTETTRYTIDELAERTGLNRRTVRYYIQLGLVERPIGETRAAYYTSDHLEQLIRVTSLAAEGLSLEAIARVLRAPTTDTAGARAPAVGSVEVRSHLTIAPGVELVVEPGRAGLSPEQLKKLFRGVLRAYEDIRNEEPGEHS